MRHLRRRLRCCIKEGGIVIRKNIRVNERIRIPEIRVIGPEGEQLGVMATQDALKRAREGGFDLVEVAANVKPPVCRIMDYSKYKYEQERRERESRKHQKTGQLKEIRLNPKIGEHEYQFKLHHLERFLKHKDKVKVQLRYRCREMSDHEIHRKLIVRIIKQRSHVVAAGHGIC